VTQIHLTDAYQSGHDLPLALKGLEITENDHLWYKSLKMQIYSCQMSSISCASISTALSLTVASPEMGVVKRLYRLVVAKFFAT
jgi:hypothetical protein